MWALRASLAHGALLRPPVAPEAVCCSECLQQGRPSPTTSAKAQAVLKGWVCCLFKHTAAFQSCTHSTAMGLLVSSPGELQESKSRTGIPTECKEAWSAAGSCEMLLFLSFKPFSPCPSIHNCLRKAERKLAYIAALRLRGLLLQASFMFLIRHLNLSSSSSSCTSEFTPNRRNRNEIEKKNK